MRASLDWISDWVDLEGLSPQDIARRLTMAGLEVDAVEVRGTPCPDIVLVRIESVRPHPGAERLRLCTVTTGDATHEVVCGAPNADVGALVPWAQPGSVLPNGMDIQVAEIRGIASPGMLCSASELGLEDEVDGLLRLEKVAGLRPGMRLIDVPGLCAHVLEIGLTPNRADALSVVGLARELGVLCERTARHLEPRPLDALPSLGRAVTVEDAGRCDFYALASFENVQQHALPARLQWRLRHHGQRPIALAVDLTNLLLLEVGQPFHAFDADKVQGDVCIRQARAGEALDALDGNDYTLDPDDLVIADAQGPIALAGVMGGRRTEVDAETRNVLLECARFAPSGVRRAARRHGLHSESSHRFERGIDPAVTAVGVAAWADALNDVLREAGLPAHPGPKAITVVEAERAPAASILLHLAFPEKILGMAVPAARMRSILEGLGCQWKERDKTTVEVTPPTWRVDLSAPIDLVEEIARVVGYEAIPSALPPMTPGVRATRRSDAPKEQLRQPIHARTAWRRMQSVRSLMRASGLDETVHVALGDRARQSLFLEPNAPLVEILNPLTQDMDVLRASLLPGLLDTVAFNRRRNVERCGYFEIAQVASGVRDASGESIEPWTLSAVLWGAPAEGWHRADAYADGFELRAAVERALAVEGVALRASALSDEEAPEWTHPGMRAAWSCGDHKVGTVAAVHPDVLDRWELKGLVFAATLDLDACLKAAREMTPGLPWSRHLPRVRDLAIRIARDVSWRDIEDTIEALRLPEVRQIQLFDVYRGEHVASDEQSLAFRLHIQGADGTPDDAMLEAVQEKVLRALSEGFGATLR